MSPIAINPWLALVIAGLLEVGWASGFKFVGPQRPVISLAVVAAMIASFWFLWLATQKLPIGTAPFALGPAELAERVRTESARIGRLITEIGLTPD